MPPAPHAGGVRFSARLASPGDAVTERPGVGSSADGSSRKIACPSDEMRPLFGRLFRAAINAKIATTKTPMKMARM